MKQRILIGWNFQRALFLLIGIFLVIQFVIAKQWLGAALGGYFAAMGLFAFGCAAGGCVGGNCNVEPKQKSATDKIHEVELGEVKEK